MEQTVETTEYPQPPIEVQKHQVADAIKIMVQALNSRRKEAASLGLDVQLSLNKLEPEKPLSVVICESTIY